MKTVQGGVNADSPETFQRVSCTFATPLLCPYTHEKVEFAGGAGKIEGWRHVVDMLRPDEIMRILKMEPHPIEGGYFAETYRTAETVPREVIPGYPAARSLSTAIYYMLTPVTISAMHRVRGDEMFHFYLGDPVEMLQLHPDGSGNTVVLGQDILGGMKLQHLVAGGMWQGSRLRDGGKFALLGTTMAPGFEYEDYETGKREELVSQYPKFAEHIRARTND